MDKIEFIRSIMQWPQKSEKWLNQRKRKLTSSDVATALGLNPYEKVEKLLFKKCGISEPFTGNVATKHGERYESEAIDIYCKLMNKKNYEFGLIEYNSINAIRSHHYNMPFDLGFLAGSPDGIAIDLDNKEDLVLLEIKCPLRRQIKPGQVPVYYRPQVIYNMAIFDIRIADFVEYIPAEISKTGKISFNIVRVHMDHKWFEDSLEVVRNFWLSFTFWKHYGIANHTLYQSYISNIQKIADLGEIENNTEYCEKSTHNLNINSFR